MHPTVDCYLSCTIHISPLTRSLRGEGKIEVQGSKAPRLQGKGRQDLWIASRSLEPGLELERGPYRMTKWSQKIFAWAAVCLSVCAGRGGRADAWFNGIIKHNYDFVDHRFLVSTLRGELSNIVRHNCNYALTISACSSFGSQLVVLSTTQCRSIRKVVSAGKELGSWLAGRQSW